MSTLVVPPRDEVAWPSLGPQVCEFIEAHLVYGPGHLIGQPAKVDRETRAIIRRAYEIHPKGTAFEGRRRFANVSMSLPKGTAKTERAAWITICEAHPDAPIRFGGWDADGEPVGIGIIDPYIPLLATTEGQSELLTYDAVRSILERSDLSDDFDIGFGKITGADGRGKIEAISTSPDKADGARTTFQVFDETHRLTDERERQTFQVMLANAVKRKDADPWSLSTTTAYMPGQNSVAETTFELAQKIEKGEHKDPSLFFFHRQANDGHRIARAHETRDNADNEEDVRQALLEAYGPNAEWVNLPGMLTLWRNPEYELPNFERFILNRPVASEAQIFDMSIVREHVDVRGNPWPPRRTEIVLGFDGSRTQDATALVGTEIRTGYQFVIGFWQRPPEAEGEWEVDGDAVDQVVADAMKTWRVRMFLADHAFWENYVAAWHGKWPKVVVIYPTSALKKTAYAVKNYVNAWKQGEVSFDGHRKLWEHLGNCRRMELTMKDEDGNPLYLMKKDRKGSPDKIDCAYAACLSWEARRLAIADGALRRSNQVQFGSRDERAGP